MKPVVKMDQIDIKEFDFSMIRPNEDPNSAKMGGFKIVIVGKPGLGKSTLIKQIIHSKRFLIPAAVVFSGSEDVNSFYKEIIPDAYIFNELDPEKLDDIFKRQIFAKKHLPNPWLLLVFDDVMTNKKLLNHVNIAKLFKNGRHYSILALFTNQYVLDLKPEFRTSIDGIFLFKENSANTRKKLHAGFASVIETPLMFTQVLRKITEKPFTCMYIDNASCNSKAWEDCIYWFSTSIVENFKFGSKRYQIAGEL